MLFVFVFMNIIKTFQEYINDLIDNFVDDYDIDTEYLTKIVIKVSLSIIVIGSVYLTASSLIKQDNKKSRQNYETVIDYEKEVIHSGVKDGSIPLPPDNE